MLRPAPNLTGRTQQERLKLAEERLYRELESLEVQRQQLAAAPAKFAAEVNVAPADSDNGPVPMGSSIWPSADLPAISELPPAEPSEGTAITLGADESDLLVDSIAAEDSHVFAPALSADNVFNDEGFSDAGFSDEGFSDAGLSDDAMPLADSDISADAEPPERAAPFVARPPALPAGAQLAGRDELASAIMDRLDNDGSSRRWQWILAAAVSVLALCGAAAGYFYYF